MRAPKELFWVEFDMNGSKRRGYRHWSSPKGGKFSTLQAAKDRRTYMRDIYPDAIITIYSTGPLTWEEVNA